MSYYVKIYNDGNFISRQCGSKEAKEHAIKEGYKEITLAEYITIYKVIKRFIEPMKAEF